MTKSRVVLATAATGHIGQHLVPLLAEDPTLKLVLPTSRASELEAQLAQHQQVRPGANVFIEEGSIKNPGWLQGVLVSHQVDTVFLNVTGDDELFTTLNFLDCAARAGTVRQLIYVSACMADFDTSEGIERYLARCSAAHVLVKPLVEQKLAHDPGLRFAWTVLRPTLFFTNDLSSRPALLGTGLLDVPFGEAGLSRVAPWDIALAAKKLVDAAAGDAPRKWHRKRVAVGSKTAFKGSDMARIWSEALAKDISVLPANEEGFQKAEDAFTAVRGPAWGRDLRLMLETFAVHGFYMTEEQYQQQLELLGQEPADYVEWVRARGREWTHSPSNSE